jgi:hypothetical protein
MMGAIHDKRATMTKKRRTYQPRIVGGKVMMPADLKRLHKYMLDIEHIDPGTIKFFQANEVLRRETYLPFGRGYRGGGPYSHFSAHRHFIVAAWAGRGGEGQ